ncbi:MAG: hypothetical protein OEM01_12950 [Desulfobulbaceae bacterium]|nr:hypothetical protein [Desulfobulbaceae bacterium]
MKLLKNIGSNNIKEIIESHPVIGEIMDRHKIGCTKCTAGTCLLQDVVTVHFLGDDAEAQIEQKTNTYLKSL